MIFVLEKVRGKAINMPGEGFNGLAFVKSITGLNINS